MAPLYTTSNGTLSDAQDINQLVNMWTGVDTTNVALNGAGIAVSGQQVPGTGKHLEFIYDTTNNLGYIQSYNRTGAAYTPLVLRGQFVAMDVGGLYVGTNHTTNPGGGNLRVESSLVVGTTGSFGGQVVVSGGGVAVTGTSLFLGNVSVNGILTVTTLSISSGISSNVSVTGNVSVSGTLTPGALSVTGTATHNGDSIFGSSVHGRFYGAGGLYVGTSPSDPGSGNIHTQGSVTADTGFLMSGGTGGYSITDTSNLPWSSSAATSLTTTRVNNVVTDFFPSGGPSLGTAIIGYLKMHHNVRGDIWLPYMQ